MGARFVDTNVLLYAASRASEHAVKLKILTEPELAVSVQVLQKFYHWATRLLPAWSGPGGGRHALVG